MVEHAPDVIKPDYDVIQIIKLFSKFFYNIINEFGRKAGIKLRRIHSCMWHSWLPYSINLN